MKHLVYILQSMQDNTYYKGYTTNITQRLTQHNNGESRYTAKKTPWKVVYVEEMQDKISALKREKQLKKANQIYLQWLIQQPINIVQQLPSE